MIGASFDSATALQDLPPCADSGKLQLPNVQRGWAWDDDRIRSAGISISLPIRAVVLLEEAAS